MGSHTLIGQQRKQLPAIALTIRVTQIRKHLPHLCATEQVLFRANKEFHKGLSFLDEVSRETVIKKTFMAKTVALSIKR